MGGYRIRARWGTSTLFTDFSFGEPLISGQVMVDDPVSHDGWLLRPDSTKNVASTSVTLCFHMTLQIGREFGFIHHQPSTSDFAVPSVLSARRVR
ncbi:hypothetical protein VNO77_22705 [Canavalia gladiata]|uniref:Uncharacterized protein n=1 Tax=Canavalia gladiata TaxID=3824 RepID=A0AAN9QEQ0_CANGL